MSRRFQSNPFSSRFVRPGAIGYRFLGDDSLESVVCRLRDNDWRGAIIGPHGSGKSTLLAALVPRLAELGWRPHSISLHDRQRWLPRGWLRREEKSLFVIDGFEQLHPVCRWWLRGVCQVRRHGLLVTAHRSIGLPVIYQSATTPELLAILANELTQRGSRDVSRLAVNEAFRRTGGNLREAFFLLYDRYELETVREPQPGAIRISDPDGSSLPVI